MFENRLALVNDDATPRCALAILSALLSEAVKAAVFLAHHRAKRSESTYEVGYCETTQLTSFALCPNCTMRSLLHIMR